MPMTLRQFFVNVGLEEEMEADSKAAVASQSSASLGSV